jgi:hypothetical protein
MPWRSRREEALVYLPGLSGGLHCLLHGVASLFLQLSYRSDNRLLHSLKGRHKNLPWNKILPPADPLKLIKNIPFIPNSKVFGNLLSRSLTVS